MSVDPKFTINEYLGVLPTGTFYWMNYVLKTIKCLGFHSEHRAEKFLPTWQLMDVLHRLKLLNALTALTLLLFQLVRSLTVKGTYVKKPVQGLNLDRRSISGLEPEMPVTHSDHWEKGSCTFVNNFIISILQESLFLWVIQRNCQHRRLYVSNGGRDSLLSVLMGWAIRGSKLGRARYLSLFRKVQTDSEIHAAVY